MTVYLVWVASRGKYALRWQDGGGRWRQRIADRTRRRSVELQRELERELAAQAARPGREDPPDWSALWTQYIRCGLAGRSAATIAHAWAAKAALGRPAELPTAAWAEAAIAELYQRYRPATVASYARRLRAMLRWSAAQGLVDPVTVRVPEAAQARGRPLALEEFERLQMAAGQLYQPARAADLVRLMRGLWCSGLRLSEALTLSWDDPGRWHIVHLDHAQRAACLVIPAEQQKGRRAEVIPAPPELVQLLRETPADQRQGPVFARAALGIRSTCGKMIAACGRRAGVRVSPRKFASAHDLRRSFALRWAEAGLAEAELAAILRHRSTQTTRQYYELIDAERLAARMVSLSERNLNYAR